MAKGGRRFKVCSKQSDREALREAGWVVEGSTKAVTGVEDGAVCPAEGEIAGADTVEGGQGGGGCTRGEGCKVGYGGSVGSAEEAFVSGGLEYVFIPK